MNHHQRLVPNHCNLKFIIVMENHLSWYIYISSSPLFCFPSTGYVKTLFEILIRHNSSTKLNNKKSFHAANIHWKTFKNGEKCFLFHLKSSFRSQDIYVFVMTFWSCMKKGLIRKIRLTSKFMTSQPAQQTITIHILSNISWSKGNQTMKLG